MPAADTPVPPGPPPGSAPGRRGRRRRGRGGRRDGAAPRPSGSPSGPGESRAPAAVHAASAPPSPAPAPAQAPPRPHEAGAARGPHGEILPSERLRGCQESIGYHFRDVALLRNALTHSSVKTEQSPSYERMEFLGDSVLGHVVAEYIYQLLPDYDEGEMTKVKSVVVSTHGLATLAQRLRLDRYLAVGRGISMRGAVPQSLLADVFEAVVAAVYLDRGFECARLFILDHLRGPIEDCLHDRHQKNYKSILQQIAQRDLNSTPTYRVLKEEGPEHRKDFEVVAVVGGYEFEACWGPTKKEAEQRAARAAVIALTQRFARRPEGDGTAT